MTPKRRANQLDGKTWTRHSISVWSDIRKSKEELALKHPALFPAQLAERIIECFLPPEGTVVLDPFCGLGSTVVAAQKLGKTGIGFDINSEYLATARERLKQVPGQEHAPAPQGQVIEADANDLLEHVDEESVDLVVTSPPYWDVLTRRRSADRKVVRNYGDSGDDLGRIGDYDEFLMSLRRVFAQVLIALKPGAYCVVVVMDIRKKNVFYPFHSDLAAAMQAAGYLWDDTIIWDRRQEYNHFRPLGYPAVFRVNKAHEYVLIFQKPRGGRLPEAIEDHLRELEEHLLRPEVRKSADRTAALLADDFVEFGTSGRAFGKSDAVEGMVSESPVRWTISEFRAVMLGPGVVLVTYRAVQPRGTSEPLLCSLRSSVWKIVDGRWRVVFHQGTPSKSA